MTASRYQNMDDPKLVSLCLGGDSEAWEVLIMRYRRLIFSIPVKFGFSPADCSDVFQTVCVKLIEHLGSLKDESKVSAWLITTTTRHCIQVKSLKYRDISDEEEIEAAPDPGETMEEIRIQSDQQQKVREAISTLAERCRRLLQLLYFEKSGPSYEDIGKSLDMPVASIGPSRARCLDKLRTILRRKGIN